MRKLFLIGFKDLQLLFRDRTALLLSLLAPLLLSVGMGFVTGSFSSDGAEFDPIPVAIINQDEGQLGQALEEVFNSEELSKLVLPSMYTDYETAKTAVDDGEFVSAILIPSGFSASIIPAPGQREAAPLEQIQVYEDQAAGITKTLVRSILNEFMTHLEIGVVKGRVSVEQLIRHGVLNADEIGAYINSVQNTLSSTDSSPAFRLEGADSSTLSHDYDPLAVISPGLALMFLMYTITHGASSLLLERANGTLARQIASPTKPFQILGGKSFGILLNGIAQMSILIAASSLLFRLSWGKPLPLILLILAAVYAAAGWGLLLASLAQTQSQVNAAGSALMLSFGMLGGSLVSIEGLPDWAHTIAKITPNYWGNEAFKLLAQGAGLPQLGNQLLALFVIGTVLLVSAILIAQGRGLLKG